MWFRSQRRLLLPDIILRLARFLIVDRPQRRRAAQDQQLRAPQGDVA